MESITQLRMFFFPVFNAEPVILCRPLTMKYLSEKHKYIKGEPIFVNAYP